MMRHCPRLLTPAQCLLAALLPATRKPLQRSIPTYRTITAYRGRAPTNGHSRRVPLTFDRLSGFTKDEEIQSQMVRLRGGVDEGGHARLSDPQMLRELLRSLDREKQCVIQISRPDAAQMPIVRIADKDELRKEVREKEQHIKQQQKESRDKKPKQIEMNWAIDGHDLEIKLKQLESFLEKGKKVEILLAAKRKGRKADMEEGTTLLQQIRARLIELGAKEIKEMEGGLLRQATMVVQKNSTGG